MPSVNRRIPRLCRHKGTGQAVARLNGCDHYFGRYGTAAAKKAYDAMIAEWLSRGRELPSEPVGTEAQSAGPTINAVILAYWNHAKDYYRGSAEMNSIRLAMRPIKTMCGQTAANRFGPVALKGVRQKMLDLQERVVKRLTVENGRRVPKEKTVQHKLSLRTINNRVRIIKRMFAWAAENELVLPSVYHGLLSVKGLRRGRSGAKDPKIIKPVPEAFVEAVLPEANRHIGAMIGVQRLTGTRSGELCRMRACDIEMTGRVWVYRPEVHKNAHRGQKRGIFIGPRAQEIIKPFLKPDLHAYLFSPQDAVEDRYREMRAKRKSTVQPSQVSRKKRRPKRTPGSRYTVFSYRVAIRRACERAGVPYWHPHQLRHNAATNLRKEHGVELARIILGHSGLDATEIYAEADRQQAMEVIAKIG